MAKKKEENPENVDRKPENLTEQASAAPEAVESAPADQTPTENALGAETETPPEPGKEAPALESLASLADRHRVPTWQQAALCRYMGWEDGKMVADADYLDALDKLKTRRVGGGRMG